MTLTLVRSAQPAQQPTTFETHLREQGHSEATVAAYLSDVRKYVTPFTGVDAHPAIAAGIVNENSAPRTRRRRISSMTKFFDHAFPGVDNPYRHVRRPTLGVVLPTVVPTPEQSRAVIDALASVGAVSDLMYTAAVALMAGAGLRVGEVIGLRFRGLDPEFRMLRFEGKGRKTREVPISEYVAERLRKYILARAGTGSLDPNELLFPTSVRSIQRAVKRGAETSGQDTRLHPHSFRHGFATAVYSGERDLRLTADLLGHANVSTTMIYTHIADDRRASAVAAAL